jgi:hypothetical protein
MGMGLMGNGLMGCCGEIDRFSFLFFSWELGSCWFCTVALLLLSV